MAHDMRMDKRGGFHALMSLGVHIFQGMIFVTDREAFLVQNSTPK